MFIEKNKARGNSTSSKIHFLGCLIKADRRLSKILPVIGLVIIMLGVVMMTLPSVIEVWEPGSKKLFQEVVDVQAEGHYYPSMSLPRWSGNEIKNLSISGNVQALEDELFDFYIFDKLNYQRWLAGAQASPFDKAQQVKSVPVSVRLTRDQVEGELFLVVANRYAKKNAEESLIDRTTTMYSISNDHVEYAFGSPFRWLFSPKPTSIVVSGKAETIDGRTFALLIMDDNNYYQYEFGRPFQTFWEGRGRSSYVYSFPLTQKQAESLRFVMRREIPNVTQAIRLSAKLSWSEPTKIKVEYDVRISWLERTSTHVSSSFIVGVGIVVLGLILSLVSIQRIAREHPPKITSARRARTKNYMFGVVNRARWRDLSESKEGPTVAFILSLVGGITVLLVGIVITIAGAALTFFLKGIGGLLGLPGILWGILMIVCAVMMRSKPEQHAIWGSLVVVFSALSWFGALGGMVVGFVLGLIGGILGIVWKPSIVSERAVTRMCPSCGRVIDPDVKFCPHCGKALP